MTDAAYIFSPPKMPKFFWFLGRMLGASVLIIVLITLFFPEEGLKKINPNGLISVALILGGILALLLTLGYPIDNTRFFDTKDFLLQTNIHGMAFEKSMTKQDYLNYYVNTLAEADFRVSTKYNVISVKKGDRFPEIS